MERFGFNINLKMSPEDILEAGETILKDGAYEAIEVTYYEHMEHVDTYDYNRAIKTIIEKYHPQVLVHISGFNLAEENSTLRGAILEEVKNCIAYTEYLGGREIIIHSGDKGAGIHVPIAHEDGSRPTSEEMYEKAFGLSVELMQKACDLAEEKGMILYTENLNGAQITVSMKEVVRYVKAVQRDNLRIVFDVGHCNHMVGEIYPEILEAGRLLQHLHIHDNHGFKKEGNPDEHLPIGEGTVNFNEFVRALKEIHYQGLYMMEFYLCTNKNLQNSRRMLAEILERYR